MGVRGKASIDIAAPVDRVIETLADMESYPRWKPGYHNARILERDQTGRPRSAEFDLTNYKQLHQVLGYTWRPDGVSWELLSGDGKEVTGHLDCVPNGDGTTVHYRYSIDPDAPVPDLLLRGSVKKSATRDLAALKTRVEANPQPGDAR